MGEGGQPGTDATVLKLLEDDSGFIWVGTMWALHRIDPRTDAVATFRHDPNDPKSLGQGYVTALLLDRQRRLWVGVGGGGLQRLDAAGRVAERFTFDPANPESLSDDYITGLFEDREGSLWVGTRSGGLNRLDPRTGRIRRYQPNRAAAGSIGHQYITSIIEDSKGRLWVGTGGGGLNRLERGATPGAPDRFTLVTRRDGLVDDNVMAIVEEDDGSLWLSTKHGLSKYDPDTGRFASFGAADGLRQEEFEYGSALKTSAAIYFGAVNGVAAISRGVPFPEPRASPTVLTAIRTREGDPTNRGPAWDLERIDIPYGEFLSLSFAVLDYNAELRHRYSYRLGGSRAEWVDLGPRREITFTNLEPGEYEFAIKGRNSRDVWSSPPHPLRIRVIPPFWMTLPFRLLVLGALCAAAVGGHYLRINALTRRNRELEALQRDRERALGLAREEAAERKKAQEELSGAYDRLMTLTRGLEAAKEEERRHIARELHDEMGQALTAVKINLRLMGRQSGDDGPLGRIGDTIGLVDRLIQGVRDLSLDLRPPLLDELGLIAALRGYLEAIAARAELGIDLDLDETLGRLPPELEIAAFRIVQEAVTNAVRHAGASHIRVRLQRGDGELNLRIQDDGHGFDVAAVAGRSTGGQHLGLLGIRERARMLGGDVALDSTPGHGTDVRVRIPLGEPM